MVIIGEKEINHAGTNVSVRTKEGKDLGMIEVNKFIESLKEQIEKYL